MHWQIWFDWPGRYRRALLITYSPCRAALPGELMIQLASPAEGMGDGEHEELGERDTLDQEKRTVSAEYS